jgi:hypothetical protein
MKWWRIVSLIFSPLLIALVVSFVLLKYMSAKSWTVVLIVIGSLFLSVINTIILVFQVSKK